MMKDALTPPQSRMLAIALLILVIGALYIFLVKPVYSHYRANEETVARLSNRLVEYRRTAEILPALEKQLQSISPDHREKNYYLKSSTEALAVAELQTYIKGIIERANGSLVSSQPLDSEDSGAFSMIRIHVRMQGNIEAIQSMFYNIESGTPVLVMDNVTLTKRRAGRRQKTDPSAGTLDVNFTLIGFIRV